MALNDNWSLWLHLPYDTDWSINSYKKVATVTTLEDAIILTENLNDDIIEKCMLFFMKNGIKPIWEDEKNKSGGCISYKVTTDKVIKVWKSLVYALAANYLAVDVSNEIFCGISISPKKNFSIIKLWLNTIESFNKDYDLSRDIEIPDPFHIDVLCKFEDEEKYMCILKKHNFLY